MDGPLDYHTNWTTFISGKKRFHLYVESKKMIQIYLQNRNKTHRFQKQLMVIKVQRWREDKLGVWD